MALDKKGPEGMYRISGLSRGKQITFYFSLFGSVSDVQQFPLYSTM